MNGYDLSRNFWDWAYENPEKIKPNHSALYFFIIEHCNRLGWKEKFGLPTTMAKEAIGIRSYNTFINTLNDLIEWGLIKMIEKSKNQYSSNIIAISKFNKAHDKALDKAFIKHGTKQSESTRQSIDSINKQETKNNKQRTINKDTASGSYKEFMDICFDFYEGMTGLKPKIDATSGKKLKSIISYLEGLPHDENYTAADLFKTILSKWGKLDEWLQKNCMDLKILDSKLPIIINELKTKTKIKNDIYTEMEQKYGIGTQQ